MLARERIDFRGRLRNDSKNTFQSDIIFNYLYAWVLNYEYFFVFRDNLLLAPNIHMKLF